MTERAKFEFFHSRLLSISPTNRRFVGKTTSKSEQEFNCTVTQYPKIFTYIFVDFYKWENANYWRGNVKFRKLSGLCLSVHFPYCLVQIGVPYSSGPTDLILSSAGSGWTGRSNSRSTSCSASCWAAIPPPVPNLTRPCSWKPLGRGTLLTTTASAKCDSWRINTINVLVHLVFYFMGDAQGPLGKNQNILFSEHDSSKTWTTKTTRQYLFRTRF